MPIDAYIGEILGLGYTGTAILDGYRLMLRGSSVTEDTNWIKVGSSRSTVIYNGSGEVLVPNRRFLTISLVCDLTPNSYNCAARNVNWRALSENGVSSSGLVYLGKDEGYQINEGFVDAVQIAAPDNSLAQVTFTIRTFDWTDLSGQVTPRDDNAATTKHPSNKPVAHWQTQVSHPGHPGNTLQWAMNFAHGYQYYQFCEASLVAPTPKVVIPGPLMADLNLTTLAYPGQRPTIDALGVSILVPTGGIISIPRVRLDPSKTTPGFGETNSTLKWQASWRVIGNSPTL